MNCCDSKHNVIKVRKRKGIFSGKEKNVNLFALILFSSPRETKIFKEKQSKIDCVLNAFGWQFVMQS
jgi:hypothetical protein